jgi:hypothetical protein
METIHCCHVARCRHADSHVTSGHVCGTCHHFGHGQIECGHPNLIIQLKNVYGFDQLPPHLRCTIPMCRKPTSHTTRAHACAYCHHNHAERECPIQPIPDPTISSKIVTCPLCRGTNTIPSNQTKVYGTGNRCVICLEREVEVFFPQCGHVCTCLQCCEQLSQTSTTMIPTWDSNETPTSIFVETIMGNHPGAIFVIIPTGMGCCFYAKRTEMGQPIEFFFMHSDDWGQYGTGRVDELNNFIHGYTQLS